MNMLDVHNAALKDTISIILHEFKIRYQKEGKKIYGFIEGKDDISYYRGFIENRLTQPWKLELWAAEGKENVIKIYNINKKQKFRKEQILYFVDRDLSKFTQESLVSDTNVYITDGYSIENSIVNSDTCDRVLREICGFYSLPYNTSDKIREYFDEQLIQFKKALAPIMVEIILLKKLNIKIHLDNILMDHLFNYTDDGLSSINNPCNCSNWREYIYKQWNISLREINERQDYLNYFISNEEYMNFIRGKYLVWFLVKFCLWANKNMDSLLAITRKKKFKKNINLSQSNCLTVIAPRTKIPESLRLFLMNTMEEYINSIKV